MPANTNLTATQVQMEMDARSRLLGVGQRELKTYQKDLLKFLDDMANKQDLYNVVMLPLQTSNHFWVDQHPATKTVFSFIAPGLTTEEFLKTVEPRDNNASRWILGPTSCRPNGPTDADPFSALGKARNSDSDLLVLELTIGPTGTLAEPTYKVLNRFDLKEVLDEFSRRIIFDLLGHWKDHPFAVHKFLFKGDEASREEMLKVLVLSNKNPLTHAVHAASAPPSAEKTWQCVDYALQMLSSIAGDVPYTVRYKWKDDYRAAFHKLILSRFDIPELKK